MSEKHITKTLATCKPSEFLRQTNKIRKSVEKWITATDILSLRKQMPVLPENATKDEKQAAMAEQMRRNLSRILDAILDEHPDETLELLALLCFIEPGEADDYEVAEYLNAFTMLVSNKTVLDFFSSLVQLGQTGILN